MMRMEYAKTSLMGFIVRFFVGHIKGSTPKLARCDLGDVPFLVAIYLYLGMSQNAVSNPGSLTRGYDSWV